MKFETIKNYRIICAEIEGIEESLSKPNKACGSRYGNSSPCLLLRKKKLCEEKTMIEDFVSKIKNYKVRRAVELYCLLPLDETGNVPSWESVAVKLGCGCTANSLKVAVSRFFKSQQK